MIRYVKTRVGFNYLIGDLIIARAQWVRVGGKWVLICYRQRNDKKRFGIASTRQDEEYFSSPSKLKSYLEVIASQETEQ